MASKWVGIQSDPTKFGHEHKPAPPMPKGKGKSC